MVRSNAYIKYHLLKQGGTVASMGGRALVHSVLSLFAWHAYVYILGDYPAK